MPRHKDHRHRGAFQLRDCEPMRRENRCEDVPSTICPTRKSIIEGIGDPASSAAAEVALGLSAAFFFSSFPAAAFCFSFFLGALTSERSALFAAGACEALFSMGFGSFSFFLVSKALRSTGGALEKSRGTRSNAGATASADLRTDG